jgi:hypothetical protein
MRGEQKKQHTHTLRFERSFIFHAAGLSDAWVRPIFFTGFTTPKANLGWTLASSLRGCAGDIGNRKKNQHPCKSMLRVMKPRDTKVPSKFLMEMITKSK